MKVAHRPGTALTRVLAALLTTLLAAAVGAAAAPAGSLAAADTRVRWHPGHYFWPGYTVRADNRATVMEEDRKMIAEVANEPTIKGVKIYLEWSAVEGPKKGDYTAGINTINQYIAWSRAAGKRLWISFLHVHFNRYDPNNLQAHFPDYIVTDPAYGVTPMANGIVSRLWQKATMDRVIAQVAAYGSVFNTNPTVEGIGVNETAMSPTGNGYNEQALADQFKRGYTAFRAAWPNAGLRLIANWLGSDATMADLIAHCRALYCLIGGPDTIPSETIQANRIYTGQSPATNPIDYRGILPFISEIQSPELGGHEGDWTPKQLWEHAVNGNPAAGIRAVRPSYGEWYRNTWQGTDAQKWHTGILPYIRSIGGAVPSPNCPTAYPGCNTA